MKKTRVNSLDFYTVVSDHYEFSASKTDVALMMFFIYVITVITKYTIIWHTLFV